MAQRLIEGVTDLMQIVGHRHIVNLQTESEGVDEHTHCVGNLQVRASAADGTEVDLAVVGVARDDIAGGSEEEVGGGDVVLAAECGEGSDSVAAYGTESLADKALSVGLGKVGGNLAGSFAGLQLLGKELLGSLEGFRFLGLLLVGDEVEVGVGFVLNGRTDSRAFLRSIGAQALRGGLAYPLPFERTVKLADEEVGGTAVEHQVVDVHQEMDTTVGLDDLEAVERRLLQIERAYKLILIGSQRLITHLRYGHFHGHSVCQSLHDGVALGSKVNAQFRMSLHDQLHDTGQFVGLDASRIAEQIRDIIYRRRRILQALEIDASLGIG